MDRKVDISVIIPVYNVELYLGKCIDSVLEQGGVSYEVILIDDGSTDNSGRICDKYKEKNENIIVIHKKNEGLGYARNSGLDIARGDYIFFLDGDDWIVRDALKELFVLAVQHGADIICFDFIKTCDRDFVYDNKAAQKPEMKKEVNTRDLLAAQLQYLPQGACLKFYRKEIFDKLRFSKVPVYEDSYSMFLFLKEARKALIINKVYYIQYRRENSLTTSKFRPENLILLECGDRWLAFCRKEYPELIEMCYCHMLADELFLLHKILETYSYRKYEKEYKIIAIKMKEICCKTDKKTLRKMPQYRRIRIAAACPGIYGCYKMTKHRLYRAVQKAISY